jgi:hypothetical protein
MINNESEFSRTLKKIGDFLIILMPIFSVGYFLFGHLSTRRKGAGRRTQYSRHRTLGGG